MRTKDSIPASRSILFIYGGSDCNSLPQRHPLDVLQGLHHCRAEHRRKFRFRKMKGKLSERAAGSNY